jgi:hypothetical protein
MSQDARRGDFAIFDSALRAKIDNIAASEDRRDFAILDPHGDNTLVHGACKFDLLCHPFGSIGSLGDDNHKRITLLNALFDFGPELFVGANAPTIVEDFVVIHRSQKGFQLADEEIVRGAVTNKCTGHGAGSISIVAAAVGATTGPNHSFLALCILAELLAWRVDGRSLGT